MESVGFILATYALTIALTRSDGAWGILRRIRDNKHVSRFGVLECFLCTSLYVSLILCLLYGRFDLWLLVWGASVLINEAIIAYMLK